MKGITSTESENSIFKTEVLETSICKCGQVYDSKIATTVFGKRREINLGMCEDCSDKERERKYAEEQHQKWVKQAMDNFDQSSLINPKLKQATFEIYEPTSEELAKAKSICQRYATNFDINNPVNLLLIGNYGTGKSHLAVSVAKTLINEKSRNCLFISTPKLLTKLRSTYNRNSKESEGEIIDHLSRVSLLVLDDIGSEQAKPTNEHNEQNWATSKIFEIMDNRIGKHTIFTTNFTVEELQERVGGRNFSRMMENTHVIKMYGDDYRLRNFK